MARRIALLVLVVALLPGCFARGFNRSSIYSRLQDSQIEVTDEEIAKAQSLKPQLAFPCRIAVYLSTKSGERWSAKDRECIEQWAQTLKGEGIAADMFIMSELFASGTTLKDMRAAAARHGAHALLVLQNGYEVDSYKNPAAVFNLTVVGGFIIPASHRNVLFVIQGGLVDVGNGFLYASMEAEGEAGVVRPSFLIEDRPAIDRAKQRALANFGPELLKRLRAVHADYREQRILPVLQPMLEP